MRFIDITTIEDKISLINPMMIAEVVPKDNNTVIIINSNTEYIIKEEFSHFKIRLDRCLNTDG